MWKGRGVKSPSCFGSTHWSSGQHRRRPSSGLGSLLSLPIAAALDVPQNCLSKTLHQLARAGVLRSVRGPRGGFHLAVPLAVPPARLTLARVTEPFDEVGERHCLLGRAQCGDRYPCAAHSRWSAVSDSLQAFFRDTTVADLMSDDARSGARRSVSPEKR